MVLDQDLVAGLEVFGPDQQFDLHLAQHGLLVGTGPTERNFTFGHAPDGKRVPARCPEESVKTPVAQGVDDEKGCALSLGSVPEH